MNFFIFLFLSRKNAVFCDLLGFSVSSFRDFSVFSVWDLLLRKIYHSSVV